jgi:outer membrane protein OmpA-like peptidoglycan-associated protein
MAGAAGPAGHSGPAGAQGPVGATGAQGVVGVVEGWTSYREFVFGYDKSAMQASDATKINEIAAYLKRNPSLQVGVDGSMDPRGTDPRNQELSDRRVSAVRNALIQAGVPAQRIQTGAFGDEDLRRDRRVEVLISTSN